VRRIVRGLRALARDDGPAVPTDVSTTTEIALHMAMHELRQNARVQVLFADGPPLPRVLADESRLAQVLVNLLVNAAQAFALPEPSRNLVTIGADTVGGYLVLEVADNGPGIDPEALPRIFDPFFTTKPVGQGTGLGLSISHSIVTALGGELRCESTPGHGARFLVKLPLATDELAPVPPSAPLLPIESGRVLLIDDNEKVLQSMARLLGREHEVVTESDPRAALARLESGERFDVVFCDVMMPRLTGKDVFERVWRLDQEQARRFVFMTGGVGRADLDQFLAEAENEQLEKPIGVQLLRSTVRRFTSRSAPSR
jgi:CheY-like chemotaxis protein